MLPTKFQVGSGELKNPQTTKKHAKLPSMQRVNTKWCSTNKKGSYAVCGQRRPKSDWIRQSDEGPCPLTESMNTAEHINEHRPTWSEDTDWSGHSLPTNGVRAFYLHCALTFVLLNPDIPYICKQCRSRSVGFWKANWSGSALFAISVWICINNVWFVEN